jgi:hypothetical protein
MPVLCQLEALPDFGLEHRVIALEFRSLRWRDLDVVAVVVTGARIARLEGHSDSIDALCMLPDGRIASGCSDPAPWAETGDGPVRSHDPTMGCGDRRRDRAPRSALRSGQVSVLLSSPYAHTQETTIAVPVTSASASRARIRVMIFMLLFPSKRQLEIIVLRFRDDSLTPMRHAVRAACLKEQIACSRKISGSRHRPNPRFA